MNSTKKIFISHSHNDREVATTLAELLSKSLNIDPPEIVNTSSDIMNLSPGAKINGLLKLARESKVFLCLYTEESKDSTFMLHEIGARLSDNGKIYTIIEKNGIIIEHPILITDQVTILESNTSIHRLLHQISTDLSIQLTAPYLYVDIVDSLTKVAKLNTSYLHKIIKQNTLGLKPGIRNDNVIQNFIIGFENLDPIQYYWSQSSNNSMIYISHNSDEHFITVNYVNDGDYGCNFAIRPQDQRAVAKGNNRYITFEARLSSENEEKVSLGIRIINGFMQHWQYCAGNAGQFLPKEVISNEWKKIEIDLEQISLWKIFESDGIGSRMDVSKPDFSIIASINISLGGINRMHSMTEGNYGKGRIDFKNFILERGFNDINER